MNLPPTISAKPPDKPSDPLVGKTLCGTYYLEELLGSGGMGAVYRARHLRTDGLCAVKVLHSTFAKDPRIFHRFQNEARVVAALNHPNIAKVFDFDRDIDQGFPFLVMELLDGEDLEKRLRREKKLPLSTVIDIAKQCCAALHDAHAMGVVHRDIKPGNIFLVPGKGPDGGDLVKLVDFGISKIKNALSQQTVEGSLLGTPSYMAPEAVRGQVSQIDGRADQWAMAVVMYEALAGRHPFVVDPTADPREAIFFRILSEEPPFLSQLRADLPPVVLAAIGRAMNKDREQRFPTIEDFLHALTAEQGPYPSERRHKRRLTLRLLIGGTVLALCGAGLYWGLHATKSHPPIPTLPKVAAPAHDASSSSPEDLHSPASVTIDLGVLPDLTLLAPTLPTVLPAKPRVEPPRPGPVRKPKFKKNQPPQVDEDLFNPE